MPKSLAIICLFLTKTFPNTSLFHLWAFKVKPDMAPVRLSSYLKQVSLITFGNSIWLNHIDWNLNGLLDIAPMFGFRFRSSGQWLKLTLAR